MEEDLTVYRDKPLGSGTYGTVNRGVLQSKFGLLQTVRDVAVKRVRRDFLQPEYMKRDIEQLSSLDHPNVVKLLHCQYDDDFLYLALELCQTTLHQYCAKILEDEYYSMLRPQPEMLLQMARGLEHIHSKQLVHQDIKPSNILIFIRDERVVLKISDIGYSKESLSDLGFFQFVIDKTMIFMAPELLNGSGAAGGRQDVDIFALGCVFYCFLTTDDSRPGEHPFGPINWNAITDVDEERIKGNIREGKMNLSGVEHAGYKSLVEAMIREKIGASTDCRPNIQRVVEAITDRCREWPVWKFGSVKVSERHCSEDTKRLVYDCSFDQTGSQLACALDGGTLAIFKGHPGLPFNRWSRKFLELSSLWEKAILSVEWDADGNHIAAGCSDGTIAVWKRSGDEWVQCFAQSTVKYVFCIKWNPYNPTLLVTASINGAIKPEDSNGHVINVWNVSNTSQPNLLQRRTRHPVTYYGDIVWINSQDLVFSTSNGKIKLWRNDQEPWTIWKASRDHQEIVTVMCWNQVDYLLLACSRDGILRIWMLKEEIIDVTTVTVGFGARCIEWFRRGDKSVVAVGGFNETVKVFFGTSFEVLELKLTGGRQDTVVHDVKFSPNGQYLAAHYKYMKPTSEWKIDVWSMESIPMQRVFQHKVSADYIWRNTLDWSPTGDKLAVAGIDKKVVVLEIPPES